MNSNEEKFNSTSKKQKIIELILLSNNYSQEAEIFPIKFPIQPECKILKQCSKWSLL
jgi:hypothetical protein